MQRASEQPPIAEAPLYVRWSPDRSPHAIELKLDMVREVTDSIAEAERLGVEVGGVLIGSFPTPSMPVLRIDDFAMVPRTLDDGPVYMLDPAQHERFTAVREAAKAHGQSAVGFIRSHLRPGPLRPSLADASLLSRQFKQPLYAILLIQAHEPRTAAFFLAINGQIPNEPFVREFRFDEREFMALPEIDPTAIAEPAIEQHKARATRVRARRRHWGLIAAIAGVLTLIGVLLWGAYSGLWLRPASNELEIAVKDNNHTLSISWDHSAADIKRAVDGVLTIRDGRSQPRPIPLGREELNIGAVEYERTSPTVQVTLTLNMPNSVSLSQSVEWQGKR